MTESQGSFIRTIGRNRITDGFVMRSVWTLSIFFPPLPIYILWKAKRSRPEMRWPEIFFQLFGFFRVPVFAVKLIKEPSIRTIRFVLVSDTHNLHSQINIPAGDVLIHAGDFSNHGSLEEAQMFGAWISSLPHRLKILVPGNHDMIMDRPYYNKFWSDWAINRNPREEELLRDALKDVRVLVDEIAEVGSLRVWGAPWVPVYAAWRTAFNRSPDDMELAWQRIPGPLASALFPHSVHPAAPHRPGSDGPANAQRRGKPNRTGRARARWQAHDRLGRGVGPNRVSRAGLGRNTVGARCSWGALGRHVTSPPPATTS